MENNFSSVPPFLQTAAASTWARAATCPSGEKAYSRARCRLPAAEDAHTEIFFTDPES